MHGQKPLWSPGAWQEYLSAAWLPARCPHVHISRASSGEPPAGRPRTPTTGFASCRFLLVTVPLSLPTLVPFLRPGVLFLLVSHPHWQKTKRPSPEGGSDFWGRSLRGMILPLSLRLLSRNYNPRSVGKDAARATAQTLQRFSSVPYFLDSLHP